ncbi:ELMO domain-containing protein 3 isoform X2 [Parasteatoda tepidariorum]|uniref:ELMO domain-containing protein 3 isoform X2 n=1 Tax=Parasteatoda tepidariorum TaxID=114398 RepID=UPI001C71C034|nr:ELMO domain-containing protein 3 isoform X2 [Parasteatoda tepidariorum]
MIFLVMHLDAIDEGDETAAVKDEHIITFGNKPAIFKHKEIVGTFIPTCKTEPISVDEVLNFFRSANMSQFLKCIKPVKQRKRIEALKHWIVGPPKLNLSLISERNLFFAIALCPFDSSEEIHIRVLQTLYRTLTNSNKDCPRYGKHWEDVGFQGIDPGTDLRGVGFLGLIHLLSFALNPATADLAKSISVLAKNEKQNFPFCAMGINITRIVVESMREEVLNRECNRCMDVFKVTNDFYAGIFLRLYVIWYQQKKTIMDSGFVIKDLTEIAKKHSSVILKELSNYLKVNQVPDKTSNVAHGFAGAGDNIATV